MSLLNGMNDMLVNQEAMESVMDTELFEDYLVMEADSLIDIMVDGEDDDDFDDDDFDDDEDDDQIANETTGSLTGDQFLASLLQVNDPIITRNGSIGSKANVATSDTNYSDGMRNTVSAIAVRNGSIGYNKNIASFAENYSHTSSDSVVESALFFEDLMGDDAIEGVLGNLKEKVAAKKNVKRQEKCKFAGVRDIDKSKLQTLIDENNFDEAIKMVTSFGKYLESEKGKFPEDDPDAVKKCKIIDGLLKTNTSLMMKLIEDKKTKSYIESGMDAKSARKKARKDSKAKAQNSESKAMETYLNECIQMMVAFEGEGRASLSDTAVGDNGSPSPENNFSDGLLDDNDPVRTKNGSVGSDDNIASFDENYSFSDLDDDDDYAGTHGGIGSKGDAKDPSMESILDDELAFLNDALFDDFEGDF